MFTYEKKLQYPVKIKQTNPRLAMDIITQYGGPDGEMAASIRYLSQRYAMPYPELKGLLTDIGRGVSLLHNGDFLRCLLPFLGFEMNGLKLQALGSRLR